MYFWKAARFAAFAVLGITSTIGVSANSQLASRAAANPYPNVTTTGLTDAIGWDGYSFFIKGKRVFLQSGEFHTWRLPVPGLWKDITQKAKAAGLNALSIYIHWHLINPKQGVIDMSGINALQPFFDAAKEAGLWWNAVIPVIAKNQITNGGPVIMLQLENEFYNGAGQNEYVEELRQRALALGIVVPTMVNDPGMFWNLLYAADIYGFDSYPVGETLCLRNNFQVAGILI
ncbi:hypothetical protein H0H81_004901 [Sphagnurus paluster]|uniref:Glycoside hydrolase 35 catalytic domain-containing protein n=1 Tax=Sphagnurus paluster TaxID=117069 RepID=A0A9P7FS87_9AGAR|nr:hypothetical protein H0H81_004901 [Sphagnurus paluster]